VLSHLETGDGLKNLSLLPICGTKFYRYDNRWEKLYSEDFTKEQKSKILDSLNKMIEQSAQKPEKVWGDLIEDRGS
jgi:hypothetical protein